MTLKKKLELQRVTLSDYKHHKHNTVEFLVCVCPIQQQPWRSNIVVDKGLNLLDECVAERVHLPPQVEECTSSS